MELGEFIFEWIGVALIVWLAAASPGPDFIISVRNSVLHSQKAGIFTALGIGLGILVHVTYCILGIAALISQSVLLFSLIKYAGAAYLIYIGIKALRSKGFGDKRIVGDHEENTRSDIPVFKALQNGFLTNLLNPKATMFFFALYSQVIDTDTPVFIQSLYGITAAIVATAWFTIVAVILNQRHIRRSFLNFSKWIDRICGGLLIALGIKLAISKA